MGSPPSPLRFGRFLLDPVQRRLLVDGQPARLGARAFDVLLALVERRERVVAKQELFDAVWPDVVVEENNLQVHISSLRKVLGPQAIATVPGRGYQFTESLDPVPGSVAAIAESKVKRPKSNLPAQAVELIGREQDLASLRALLQAESLVSIVGPSGVGKTRLALAAAQQVAHEHPDGIWWVDLSTVASSDLLESSLAHELGIVVPPDQPAASTIVAALHMQSILLVLDNCEHVLAAVAALVGTLRRQAPDVHVLVTSQEDLRIAGEQRYRLAPLPTGAARDSAEQLFAARARAVDPHFELTAANLGTVSEICRRLDGLPLAIELAAARLPLLGLDRLSTLLDQRFRVLTAGPRDAPQRHETLYAAFDWSHELLSAAERTVFRRLAVFAGGFSLELAQRVAADDVLDQWAVLEHLGSLVNKSLVVTRDGGPAPRYRLLETARSYANEQLERAGELDATRRRHALAMLETLQVFDNAVTSAPRIDTLAQRLAPDLDNLRAALRWAAGTQADRGLAIALAAHGDFLWGEIDPYGEGLDHCLAVARHVDAETPAPVAARFWLAFAHLGRVRLLSLKQWTDAARRALAGFRTLDDRVRTYRALTLLGGANRAAIDEQEAGAMLDEAARLEDQSWSPHLRARRQVALEWWHDLGGRLDAAHAAGRAHLALESQAASTFEVGALSNLADTEFELGRNEAAVALCRQAIDRAAELARPGAAAHAHTNIVPALLAMDDLEGAAQAFERGRAVLLRTWGSAFTLLVYLPLFALKRGGVELAAQLLGSADRAYSEGHHDWHPPERRARARVLAELEPRLGAARLAELQREGAAWSEDEAFDNAGIG